MTGNPNPGPPLRSANWFERDDLDGFLHRAWLKTGGYEDEAFRGRPIIGICNSWSELVTCNAHLRELAESVKRGVLQAGGFPLEFPVMSPGEALMKPTTMLYRNLMAMDVEETIRGYPIDGVVLLAGCDKTVPGALMGAASANVPSLMVTGGPMLNGHWRGEVLGSCSDCWRLYTELRAGRISRADWHDLEGSMSRSRGHCMTMGTASTMACVTEALGMMLPGGAAIPAVDSRRGQLAEASGRAVVALVNGGLRPSDVLTREAFENAIRVLHAISGSTNAVLHLLALAGRVGVPLAVRDFDDPSKPTPWLANIKPAGEKLMEDFFYAGGVPALMSELRELLHLDAGTVSGQTVGENVRDNRVGDAGTIASVADPLSPAGGLAVLYGNLCPGGALIKHSAATPTLLHHVGTAVVFEDFDDLTARINDPDLEVDADSILVLKGAGPVGAPGMPEWGSLPIPEKLLRGGVSDLVRISDARMSGTSYGTIVLHVTPESAVGGPLAIVRNGDQIVLDVAKRRLDLQLDERELEARRKAWRPPVRQHERGYLHMYERHVTQADEGCDFDFLRGGSPVVSNAHTYA